MFKLVAKDGTQRGGYRPGAGRKKKALAEKILEGKAERPEKAAIDVNKPAYPPPRDFLDAEQKNMNGIGNMSHQIYDVTMRWIVDLGGIACALAALKKMKPNPDYELFFKSAAVMWRESMTREKYEETGEYDSHAAGTNRTNLVFKTLPEFYETFDIKPGDGMYVAPEKRVKVW